MAAKYLKKENLVSWLQTLAKERLTLVPRREGDAVVFRPFAPGQDIPLDQQATTPPKAAVFPQCEPLLAFKYAKDPENPGKVGVQVKEKLGDTPSVVVGCRPCDARGFLTFDRVYDSDRASDLNYLTRRRNTLFATLACDEPASTCFCNWVGSGPADAEGSDILMVPVEGGFVLEPVTEAGEKLMEQAPLEDAGDKAALAEAVKENAAKALGEAPDLSQAREKLLSLFDNMDFWESVSAKCISCGACTYLCPTCYCFNITDEQSGAEGVRLRTWDNCMSYLFTMEASGHNPRPTKAHRLKNRVGHKFSYYPDIHDGHIACCGCGRCIKSCPSSVDIRQIVLQAIAASAASE
ncbi:MAG: 4Fe-4S dicluster domain-containing protein [Desulfovibrionaceae bacterium]